jgi:hypothetical protein
MKACIAAIMIVLLTSAASAQFRQGDFEMMLLGTAGSFTEKVEYTSKINPALNGSSDESNTYAYIAIAPAYYFIDGLAAELELGLRAMEGGRPAQSAILNLAFTHQLRGSAVALFARAGYGMANSYSIPVFLDLGSGRSDEFDISIINLGAGAKFMVGRSAFIRTELNYRIQNYSYDTDFSESDYTYNTIAVLLGVGLVL